MNPPPQYKLVPFPEPSNLCQASRIPGYVSLPSQPPTTTPTPMARSTHASSSSSATTNTPDQTASLDTAPKVPIVAPLSSGLQRQASMAGNVLVLQKDNKDDTTTKKTKKEYRAFLLQRKLEETPKGNYTIRAGYPLALLDYDNNDDGDEDNRNSSLAHRIWQVEANAPLVAIHIHTMSADSDSTTTTTTTSMAQESTMVQYNPRAEWFVWSHSCNDHNNALSSCSLGSEWMGSCSSSKDAPVIQNQPTAASSTTSMQQDDSSIGSSIALPQNSSLYYSVTPLYPTSLWDELCARQQQAKQEKNQSNEASPSSSSALVTEDEARHVFTQILQVCYFS